MTVYVATENPGKACEMKRIFDLRLPGTEVKCVADLPDKIREAYCADETGSTYTENALIKAKALARLVKKIIPVATKMSSTQTDSPHAIMTPLWILSEDSGFEVEALGKAPGVYSARYAPTDKERCQKILAELQKLPHANRAAQFIACVVVMEDGRNPTYFFGRHRGQVADEHRGELGFGYDPIFIPDGESRTWGEVPEETKLIVSHRRRALELAIQYMIARTSR
jgi:XTP/dITP diphosphohydrolase